MFTKVSTPPPPPTMLSNDLVQNESMCSNIYSDKVSTQNRCSSKVDSNTQKCHSPTVNIPPPLRRPAVVSSQNAHNGVSTQRSTSVNGNAQHRQQLHAHSLLHEPNYENSLIDEPIYTNSSIREPIYSNSQLDEPIYANSQLDEPIYANSLISESIYANSPVRNQTCTSKITQPIYSNAPPQRQSQRAGHQYDNPIYGSAASQRQTQRADPQFDDPTYGSPDSHQQRQRPGHQYDNPIYGSAASQRQTQADPQFDDPTYGSPDSHQQTQRPGHQYDNPIYGSAASQRQTQQADPQFDDPTYGSPDSHQQTQRPGLQYDNPIYGYARREYQTEETEHEVPLVQSSQQAGFPSRQQDQKIKKDGLFKRILTSKKTSNKCGDTQQTDLFTDSEKISVLTVEKFNDYIKQKDAALVMFYDVDKCADNITKWSKKQFTKAADTTKRTNSAFAAVDCAKDTELCNIQHINTFPTYKLYTRGIDVGTFRDYQSANYKLLKSYVEKCPLLEQSRQPVKKCAKISK